MNLRSRFVAGILLLLRGLYRVRPAAADVSIDTRTVALYATVTDAQKRLVPDLDQHDFEILDNDKPQVSRPVRQ